VPEVIGRELACLTNATIPTAPAGDSVRLRTNGRASTGALNATAC